MIIQEKYVKCKQCKKEIILARMGNSAVFINVSSLTERDIHWLINRNEINYNELINFRNGIHVLHHTQCKMEEPK